MKLWSHCWLCFFVFFVGVGEAMFDVKDDSLAFYWLVLNKDALVPDYLRRYGDRVVWDIVRYPLRVAGMGDK